ncbi:hypothetical protein ATANTOWER_020778 [Ataeniobius toweri]|uniref:Uncharacterized protein n=1 Tax=Ataeniobius toweri TaxID=208326 RepID=A0ABU7AHT7_9TELE|nr:hypothetical protein [Ataeniobius toweri]
MTTWKYWVNFDRLPSVINHTISLQTRKKSQSPQSIAKSAAVGTSTIQALHRTAEQKKNFADKRRRPAPEYRLSLN